jgi:8-oxo-dGTP pyrophosphatase MutT (NUDIX family)
MKPAFDLAPSGPLKPSDAVAALIRTSDGRYLLQLRDAVKSIFYPDHWGCFGGAMEPGESEIEALRRELREELAMALDESRVQHFGRFRFNVDGVGIPSFDRIYYDVVIDAEAVEGFTLGEGAAMELVDGKEALHDRRLVPYDGFALWLHYYRGMLAR